MTTTVPETAIIPNFDDEDGGDRKMVIICSKGSLDMAYPALVLGNAALSEGIEVHLFFTFWGLDMITDKTMDHLKFSPVGNPATHMPNMVMGLPGMTSFATHMMKKSIEELEIPEVREFLELIADAGGHLWACKMSIDMMHLAEDDLFDRVEDIINATDFMDLSVGAQTLFI